MMEYREDFEEAEKQEKLRVKMLKYILYKKRTELEVRNKFSAEEEAAVEDAIHYFKELDYINDWTYIDRSVEEFINLKNLSLKEIHYKLCQKGVSKNLVEEYMSQYEDKLLEYELHSAKSIWQKKKANWEDEKIKQFLYKKGYQQETIKKLEE